MHKGILDEGEVMIRRSSLFSYLFAIFLVAPLLAQVTNEREIYLQSLLVKQTKVANLNQQLLALEPYVVLSQENLASLDSGAARQAGFSDEVIKLAEEIIEAQNEMVLALSVRRSGGTSKQSNPLRINFSGREAMAKFLSIVTEVDIARDQGYLSPSSTGSTHACGTYDNPVPSSTPTWWLGLTAYKDRAAAEKELIRQGFHKTYLLSDYTQGRSYNSNWGTCAKPIFRNHGVITSKFKINIQYGECNPEIHTYTWPYWNFGVYCSWWHDRF